ncbi:hypothetical protein [Microbacterium ulmi]|uniref:Uncharacterized protein n=1 Tax=Microbacterium ulmi TaxID=179095 RepID=A0A7Y2M0B6_9MICO|nr:hypothetical protein [Microbacterium ulmi]NNH03619.1 hypothetical protein [Microbacterium ulmi]
MSTETIAIVISTAGRLLGLLTTFFGAFAWMIRRTDARFERLGERIRAVETELVEVKIGIARLEGPPRRLVPAR